MHTHLSAPRPELYDAAVNGTFAPLLTAMGGLTVRGLEHLDREGPFMVASTHRSSWDILTLATAARRGAGLQLHFMAKQSLLEAPVLGPFLENCGVFPIVQGEELNDETREHIAAIGKADAVLALFPEGTRLSGQGETMNRRSIKRGTALLALEYGWPIIPVGQAGTDKGEHYVRSVVFGPAIPVEPVPPCTKSPSQEKRQLIKASRPLTDTLFNALSECQTQAYTDRRTALAKRRLGRLLATAEGS